MFHVCCCCDRGHRYCSDHCRQEARRRQRREANRKYQKTEHGRADHRDRQRNYRERQAEAAAGVTDQSSPCQLLSGKITSSISFPAAEPFETAFKQTAIPWKWIVCIKCGRVGVYKAENEAKE